MYPIFVVSKSTNFALRHMGNVIVCVLYAVDSLKQQEETMNTGRQFFSTSGMIYFTCRQGRTKVVHGLNGPQNHENGTDVQRCGAMVNVAQLTFMTFVYTNVWHMALWS